MGDRVILRRLTAALRDRAGAFGLALDEAIAEDLARAALWALAEPTEAMVRAAEWRVNAGAVAGADVIGYDAVAEIYRLMLQHALAGSPEPPG